MPLRSDAPANRITPALAEIYPLPTEINLARLKSSVRDALRPVDDPDASILVLLYGLEDGQHRTLQRVGDHFGVTRERIRQKRERALAAIRRNPTTAPPLEDALNALTDFAERLGCALEEKDFRTAVAGQDESAHMVGAYAKFMRAVFGRRHKARKSLRPLDSLVIRSLGAQSKRLTLRRVERMARADKAASAAARDWPQLDFELRLKMVLGLEMDGRGRLTVTEKALSRLTAQERRLSAMFRTLTDEGRPLRYTEIGERVRAVLPPEITMSDRNVHAWLDRYKTYFKWVGAGTYGLAEWDMGIRAANMDASLKPARRTGIGDEIALLLYERAEPVWLGEIEEHIIRRFQVNRSSIQASIIQDKAGRFVAMDDGRVALSMWQGPAARQLP